MGQFAKLTSTTKRTLHFYDQKGLLKPSGYNEQGHRTYTDEDLFRLQQILALKYLDYSLDEIKEYLEGEGSDFKASLEKQYELLLQKQQHIQQVVATMERLSAIVNDNHTLDPELIMMMIHSIQHEGEVKKWFSERLPDAFVQSMFKRGASMEPEIMIAFNDLLLMSKQGLLPEDPLVQECARSLKLLIDKLLGQPLEELGMSEMGKTLIGMEFPSHIQPELINYFFEALRYLILKEGEGI
ncbi:MerR family transcriptional regulator [Paenibacillus gorillae]|uniref:MerR family transcriptional regulator n=1 Tax=Paenibacillus gorillae TaxID=1243662 RepID=UPI0004B613E0|nr:MerR family transcriptional regulator [Paenibacillus gorillae]